MIQLYTTYININVLPKSKPVYLAKLTSNCVKETSAEFLNFEHHGGDLIAMIHRIPL